MDMTASSSPSPTPAPGNTRADHGSHNAYATGRSLMTDQMLDDLLERLRAQCLDERDLGEALRGAVEALLDVAIDHAEPRDGVVGYLAPGQPSTDHWRYLCRGCVPTAARQIEGRIYADSEIAAHASCERCRRPLHAACAVA